MHPESGTATETDITNKHYNIMQIRLYEYFRDLHPYADRFTIDYNDIYKHINILPCYIKLCLQALKSEGKIDYDTYSGGAYIIMIRKNK